MKNMKSIINSHNRKILNGEYMATGTCNCIKKEKCPLNNKCLTSNVIYEARISSTSNNNFKTYIGATEGTFKKRYANHKKSFNNLKYKNDTELPKEFWTIKQRNEIPTVNWSIKKKCRKSN